MNFPEYQNYKWFFTSSDKLVVGGKSAEQNDELLKKFKSEKNDFVVMHTSSPGSPFSIILADKKSVNKSDVEETAVFTACFSQQWKQRKKKAVVDIFSLSQVSKLSSLKTGTWQVKGKIKKMPVVLSLVLTTQKEKLRAVPEKTSKKFLIKLKPGKTQKEKFAEILREKLENKFSIEEILSALPAGGISISK